MNIEELRDYCIAKPGTTEEILYHDDAMAFKVMDKVYVQLWLTHWDAGEPRINLKCDPQEALKLREKHPQVIPGYHMSKKHWNTVHINTGLPDQKILHFINHSYDLVVRKLSKKLREKL
ncbi:MAG TPA: MmcQ/YjbR family DNA-binding protein [Leeuwenhoekiella sp.]|nr:MmcQ/YjbR family DNA-binding protein [Leeuwenhoekiella sp.]